MIRHGGEISIKAIALAFILTAFQAPSLPAQEFQLLRGMLLDSISRAPIAGAFVRAQTVEGQQVGAVVTDSLGNFDLHVKASGSLNVVVERLGYTTSVIRVDLGAGRSNERIVVSISTDPIKIPTVTAQAPASCEKGGLSARTAVLWEEIRKALRVAEWTASSTSQAYTVWEIEREFDAQNWFIRGDSQIATITDKGSPYKSLPPDDLLTFGFVRADSLTGGFVHYGPDPAVLLSDQFLSAYCLSDVPQRGQFRGLQFARAQGDEIASIRGVLWSQIQSNRLHAVDFEFENPPYRHKNIHARGRVEFEQQDNGSWSVTRWLLRTPRFAEQSIREAGKPVDLAFIGYRETERRIIQTKPPSSR